MVSLWNLALRNLWKLIFGDSYKIYLLLAVMLVLPDDCSAVLDARVIAKTQSTLALYRFCVER